MTVVTKNGKNYHTVVDARAVIPIILNGRGDLKRFRTVSDTEQTAAPEHIEKIISLVHSLETVKDVRIFTPLLLSQCRGGL